MIKVSQYLNSPDSVSRLLFKISRTTIARRFRSRAEAARYGPFGLTEPASLTSFASWEPSSLRVRYREAILRRSSRLTRQHDAHYHNRRLRALSRPSGLPWAMVMGVTRLEPVSTCSKLKF